MFVSAFPQVCLNAFIECVFVSEVRKREEPGDEAGLS